MELVHSYKDLIKIMGTINNNKGKNIVYFGTGNMASVLQSYLPLNVAYCVDNDLKKQGFIFNGLNIKNPNNLLQEEREKVFILIASIYYDEINQQLQDMGFIENKHFINGNTIYNFIYKSSNILTTNQIIDRLLSIKGYTHKKILMAGNYNLFDIDYNKLSIAGIKNLNEVFFINGETVCEIEYKFDISEGYKNIRFKEINLFDVSVYEICVELQINLNQLDYKNQTHKNAILKWYNISCNYIEQVTSYFNTNKFSKVIIAQGYIYDTAILRQIAMKNNIEVLSLEYTFNKDKFIWDNISGICVNQNLSKNYYWRYKELISINDARNYTEEFINNVKKFKKPEHQSPIKKLNRGCGIKRIFYIGQVYTDSAILFGMWNFFSQIDIIKVLVNYSIENEYELIIKTHPKEINGRDALGKKYNNLTFCKIKEDKDLFEKIRSNNNILLDYKNEYDTYDIIESSDVCVTINSQAGLESLVKGKDVVLCGSSYYDGLGFTYEAHNKEMLRFFLNMVLKSGVSLIDKDKIDKFFYIFNKYYCLDKNEISVIEKILE